MTDTKDKKREKLGILCCTAGATSWGLSGTCSEALFSQYPVDTTWVCILIRRIIGKDVFLIC